MRVQARIALDGGGVYAVAVEPEELRRQLVDGKTHYLEFADPNGFVTLIPRDKVLMVQYGSGIPSLQDQVAEQNAQFQQMQQQYAQVQRQYTQMQQQFPQQYPQGQQGQQVQQVQRGQNPFQW